MTDPSAPTNPPQTMSSQNTPSKEDLPIDKFFWYNLSRKWVGNGLQNIVDVGERLKTAIAWFFGLGTSGIFISMILGSEPFKDLDLTLFWIPLLLFLVSYGLAVMGQTISLNKDFKPNEHDSIRLAYNHAMKYSRIYIISSAVCLIAGFLSFPFILKIAVDKKKIEKAEQTIQKPILTFEGGFITNDTTLDKKTKKTYIEEFHVTGQFTQKANNLRLFFEKGKGTSNRKLMYETFVIPDSANGQFFLVIPSEFNYSTILNDKETVFLGCEYADAGSDLLKRTTIELTKFD